MTTTTFTGPSTTSSSLFLPEQTSVPGLPLFSSACETGVSRSSISRSFPAMAKATRCDAGLQAFSLRRVSIFRSSPAWNRRSSIRRIWSTSPRHWRQTISRWRSYTKIAHSQQPRRPGSALAVRSFSPVRSRSQTLRTQLEVERRYEPVSYRSTRNSRDPCDR